MKHWNDMNLILCSCITGSLWDWLEHRNQNFYEDSRYMVLEEADCILNIITIDDTNRGFTRYEIGKFLGYFIDILQAVIYYQELEDRFEIIHRDLKPRNILYSVYSSEPTFFISDFGIAQAIANCDDDIKLEVSRQSQLYGSSIYSAPEQVSGQQCTKYTDYFSLGVILFELLYPQTRFELEKSVPDIMEDREIPDKLQNLFPELSDLIIAMLNKNPKERPGLDIIVPTIVMTRNTCIRSYGDRRLK